MRSFHKRHLLVSSCSIIVLLAAALDAAVAAEVNGLGDEPQTAFIVGCSTSVAYVACWRIDQPAQLPLRIPREPVGQSPGAFRIEVKEHIAQALRAALQVQIDLAPISPDTQAVAV